jgi:dTDP-4-amino-4,6-dideoxygalactose transaminase
MYYVLNQSTRHRDNIIASMKADGVHSVFHYVPLHSSPFGKKFAKSLLHLPVTDFVSANLIRLPLWLGMSAAQQSKVVNSLAQALGLQTSAATPPLALPELA